MNNDRENETNSARKAENPHDNVVLRLVLDVKTGCDNAVEMSPGSSTESYPAFARIELRENPGKTSTSTDLDLSTALAYQKAAACFQTETPDASRSSLLSKNLKVRIYKTVILPVVLCGCETWTLTLREEHRLRVFENEVLRKIFGAKRDEVTGEWRKLHSTELHALYSSPDIIRNIKSRRSRWAGHVERMGESKNPYRVLVERPEGKRPLGRPRRRWEDNIKMDLREVGYDSRDWINLAQDRDQWRAYVRGAMNLRDGLVDEITDRFVIHLDDRGTDEELSGGEESEFEEEESAAATNSWWLEGVLTISPSP
ncbi:hypothetical protein ANN_05918 [Periplaneta americana]|uniref:Uncharacterized protein n=1 Tax=Periplaneta americana TaxID=6978 RepID=A0ABQ8TC89_PERAM|nr:hypothetical protein ANN_05918 [Periplaneta americana]